MENEEIRLGTQAAYNPGGMMITEGSGSNVDAVKAHMN
jgi:hypothetical protein